jgi:hypothetical protein
MERIMATTTFRAISEMKEFATFSAAAQRYIRRSLDVAAGRPDALAVWARSHDEANSISRQSHVYSRLSEIEARIPDDSGILAAEAMMTPLVSVSGFDLLEGKIGSFAAYRFLYERLLGVRVRPWLPSAFLAAAAMPAIHPAQRRRLLMSISEGAATAPGWSTKDLEFFPTWVDKVETEAA